MQNQSQTHTHGASRGPLTTFCAPLPQWEHRVSSELTVCDDGPLESKKKHHTSLEQTSHGSVWRFKHIGSAPAMSTSESGSIFEHKDCDSLRQFFEGVIT